jgi:hypothetical protein
MAWFRTGHVALLLACCLLPCAQAQCDESPPERCAAFNREPCVSDNLCGSCLQGFIGATGLFNERCFEPVPVCDPATTCSGNGFCRSDQSCLCAPAWYGPKCDSQIEADGFSDVGLAGVIIAFLVGLPLMVCGCSHYHKKRSANEHEGGRFGRRARPQPRPQASASQSFASSSSRGEREALAGGQQAAMELTVSPPGRPPRSSKAPQVAGAGAELSGQRAQALQDFMDITATSNRATAQRTLEAHGWKVESAVNAHLTSMV